MRCMNFGCSTLLLLVLTARCCLSDPPASLVPPKVAVIQEKQAAIIAIPQTPTQVQMLVKQMADHGFTTLYLPADPRLIPGAAKRRAASRFSSASILASAVGAGKKKKIAVSAIVTVYPWSKKDFAVLQLSRLDRLAHSLAILPGLKSIVLENGSAASIQTSATPIQVIRGGRPRANELVTLSELYRGIRSANPNIPVFVHENSSSMSFNPWIKMRAGTRWISPTSPDVVKRGSVLLVSFNRSYGGCYRCGDGTYTSLQYPLAHYHHQLGGTSGAVAFDLRPDLAEGTLFASLRYLTHLTRVASIAVAR